MNKGKNRSTAAYLAATAFCTAAVFNFVNADTSTGIIWLALGSAFLCLGSAHGRKAEGSDGDDRQDKAD